MTTPFCRNHTRHRRREELPPSEQHRSAKIERAYSPDWYNVFDPRERDANPTTDYVRSHRLPPPPETEMQALMEAPPNIEPERSMQESLPQFERITTAIDGLEPRLLWIFNAHVFEEKSFRTIARELNLGHTHIHREFNRAKALLQGQLGDMIE